MKCAQKTQIKLQTQFSTFLSIIFQKTVVMKFYSKNHSKAARTHWRSQLRTWALSIALRRSQHLQNCLLIIFIIFCVVIFFKFFFFCFLIRNRAAQFHQTLTISTSIRFASWRLFTVLHLALLFISLSICIGMYLFFDCIPLNFYLILFRFFSVYKHTYIFCIFTVSICLESRRLRSALGQWVLWCARRLPRIIHSLTQKKCILNMFYVLKNYSVSFIFAKVNF